MLTCQKHLFSLPDSISYLNCAYQGPLLKKAEQIGVHQLHRKATPYNIVKKDFFDPVQELKIAFSKLINANQPERIAYIASASYGIANVCKNIKPVKGKTNIILAAEQFPSNYYPWSRMTKEKGLNLKTVKAPETTIGRAQAWNQRLLDAIDEQTLVVSIGQVHWTDGTKFDLKAIREKTRAVGALMIIDGTQTVGALPFDVQDIQPDALICAGYKWLLGPYGCGLAYYSAYFDEGIPIEENWMNREKADDFQNLVKYQENYQPGAARYNIGQQSNFTFIPMLSESIQQILHWSTPQIQDYCQQITQKAIEELLDVGCLLEQEDYRVCHLFGILLNDQFDLDRLKTLLDQQHVFVSYRGQFIRVAPNVYNNENDMQKLVGCVKAAKRVSSSLVK